MFSGIIEKIYRISARAGSRISVDVPGRRDRLGDSIAVNGVCLTVSSRAPRRGGLRLSFDLSPETLKRTALGSLKKGATVNIERALRFNAVIGGHLVQGHVDGVGRVAEVGGKGENRLIWFDAPAVVRRYLVPKGSVAVDGISLTVASIRGKRFAVAVIPFTLTHTTLGVRRPGDRVNLEADMIAKYLEKFSKR